jgi:hypothetical protein
VKKQLTTKTLQKENSTPLVSEKGKQKAMDFERAKATVTKQLVLNLNTTLQN